MSARNSISVEAKALGETLRKLRKRVDGLTQDRMGELLGITGQQISKYERGESSITIETFNKIKKVTDELSVRRPTGEPEVSFGLAEDQASFETPNHILVESLAILQKEIQDLTAGMDRLRKL